MGIWASCNGLAFIIGPTFGGWLVDSVGWRSIFYMSLPACAAALFLTLYAIEESRKADDSICPARSWPLSRSAASPSPRSKDRIGDGQRRLLATAAFAAAAFVWTEARTPGPFLPLSLLSQPVISAALAA